MDFYPRVIADSLSIYRESLSDFIASEKESTRERSVGRTEKRFNLTEYIDILFLSTIYLKSRQK